MHIFTYCVLGAAERPNATYVNEPSSLSLFGILDKVYTFVHLLHQTLFRSNNNNNNEPSSLTHFCLVFWIRSTLTIHLLHHALSLSLAHVCYLPAYASRETFLISISFLFSFETFLSDCVRERRVNCNGEDLKFAVVLPCVAYRRLRMWTCWHDTPLDARERNFRSVDLLQFPFELAHNCIFLVLSISSGALTCYNFHSNSHIVAFFLVFTIYIYVRTRT